MPLLRGRRDPSISPYSIQPRHKDVRRKEVRKILYARASLLWLSWDNFHRNYPSPPQGTLVMVKLGCVSCWSRAWYFFLHIYTYFFSHIYQMAILDQVRPGKQSKIFDIVTQQKLNVMPLQKSFSSKYAILLFQVCWATPARAVDKTGSKLPYGLPCWGVHGPNLPHPSVARQTCQSQIHFAKQVTMSIIISIPSAYSK